MRRLSKFFYIIIFSLCTVFSLLWQTNAYALPPQVGQVISVNGTLNATRPDGSSRALQRRSAIYEHDSLVTNANSTGQIVFTDGSTVTLANATTLNIDSYKFRTTATKQPDEKYALNLVKGGLRTITGAIPKDNPDAYQINTPAATIGVRGTNFTIAYCTGSVCGSQGLVVGVSQGVVTARNNTGLINLGPGLNTAYATIASIASSPKITTTPPPGLPSLPITTPAAAKSINDAGNSGSGSGTIAKKVCVS